MTSEPVLGSWEQAALDDFFTDVLARLDRDDDDDDDETAPPAAPQHRA